MRKDTENTDKEYLETPPPELSPEAQAVIKATDSFMKGSGSGLLKDENRYYVALKLFDPNLLELVTELNDEQIQTMTRHDSLGESMKQLGHLTDAQAKPFMEIKNTMHKSFMKHQISRKRKSRTEIVDILKDTAEHTIRTIGDKLKGKSA